MSLDSKTDFIEAQRSIRNFTDEVIDDATLDTIFDSAKYAPTAGGMQNYSVIVTRAPQRLKELAEIHQYQPAVMEATVLLTYCVDVRRATRWSNFKNGRPGFYNYLWYMMGLFDVTIFAQNVNLVARSMGLGGCFIGSTVNYANEIIDFLDCPAGVIPALTFSIGVPSVVPDRHTRLPSELLIHSETYQDLPDGVLADKYREHEQGMFDAYVSVPELKQVADEFNISGLSDMWTRLNYVTEPIEAASAWYLSALCQQGFIDDAKFTDIKKFRTLKEGEFYQGLSTFEKTVITYMLYRGDMQNKKISEIEHYFTEIMKYLEETEKQLHSQLQSPSIIFPEKLVLMLDDAIERFLASN